MFEAQSAHLSYWDRELECVAEMHVRAPGPPFVFPVRMRFLLSNVGIWLRIP